MTDLRVAPRQTPMALASQRLFRALLSAAFAKAGLQDIDSDCATLLRTGLVLVLLAGCCR